MNQTLVLVEVELQGQRVADHNENLKAYDFLNLSQINRLMPIDLLERNGELHFTKKLEKCSLEKAATTMLL